MIDYAQLSRRDASMYFNECLAIDREANTPHRVYVCESFQLNEYVSVDDIEDKHRRCGYCYAVFNTTTTRSGATAYTPAEFHAKFFVSKFPLGWVNCDNLAVYLYSPLSRSTAKGHRRDSLQTVCPYAEALSGIYSATIANLEHVEDIHRERLSVLRTAYRKALIMVREGDTVVPKVRGNIYQPRFHTPQEVLVNFTATDKPAKVGMAMSRAFAASVNRNFFGDSAGLYYHTKQVGAVLNDGFKLFEPFLQIRPQFERTFGQDIGVI